MPKRNNEKPYYPTLEAEIVKRGILKKKIAEKIGIAPRTLSHKMTGKLSFSLDEAITAQEAFFPDIEIKALFQKK